jgi:hypothetical protein
MSLGAIASVALGLILVYSLLGVLVSATQEITDAFGGFSGFMKRDRGLMAAEPKSDAPESATARRSNNK